MRRVKIYGSIFIAVFAVACHRHPIDQVDKSNFFGADAAIAPFETKLTIGGIYTTIGSPKKLVSGARIDQFCDVDTKYASPEVDESGVIVAASEEKIDGSSMAKLGAQKFPGFSVSLAAGSDYSAAYTLKNVTRTRLANSEFIIEDIITKIGSKCRGYIRAYQRQGRDVFVLLEGYKAERVEGTINHKRNAEAGVTVQIAGQRSSPIDAGADWERQKRMAAENVFIEVSGFKIEPGSI
ncbi:Uncharacterised protein [Pannonibacter phragmitetus]|uniref:Uncharacterized protein n=1 Tax=Pannonibacter phragmitetus TaxID=121719 RepID=A0A378ZR88_9HYPH|nr:hypothetical protein [Pannonibacter phragmitetus]SUA99667.1 Uncharacterised protein [Pannonibacter phragmitetus]